MLEVQRKPQQLEEGVRVGAQKWRILQEPRSLLISVGEVYEGCLHGIEGVDVDEGLGPWVGKVGDGEEVGGEGMGVCNWELLGDQGLYAGGSKERGTRISLTFRDVIRVKKIGKALGGLMKGRG